MPIEEQFGELERAAVIFLKAEGKSDRSIGRMGEFKMPDGVVVKLPSRDTIEEWRNPESKYYDAAFSRQYARACEDSLWSEHEKMQEINLKLERGEIDPSAARVMSDNIKWDLARRMRHIFGDRLAVEGGDKPVAVEHSLSQFTTEELRKLAMSGTN